MNRIVPHLSSFCRDERGATAIEYGLIAGVISMAMITCATQVGTALMGFFARAATAIGG